MAYPATAGVDYSTKALHIAIVRGAELVDMREIALGLDVRNQVGMMAQAAEWLRDYRPESVWMEALWFGGVRVRRDGTPAPAVSNITTLDLHRIATRFETLAVAAGLIVRFVPIASWRLIVFGHGRPGDAKKTSLDYCARVYGWRAPNHNASDAVCLATYGAAMQRTPRTPLGREP